MQVQNSFTDVSGFEDQQEMAANQPGHEILLKRYNGANIRSHASRASH